MLLEDLLLVLDDQYRLVAEVDGVEDPGQFFARLWQLICRLRRDPRTKTVLNDLLAEAVATDRDRRAAYAEHARRSNDILVRLEIKFPDLFTEPTNEVERMMSHLRVRRIAERAHEDDRRVEELRAHDTIAIARAYLDRAKSQGLTSESPFWEEINDLERSEQLSRRTWRVNRVSASGAYQEMMGILWPLDIEKARESGLIAELAGGSGVTSVIAWADEEDLPTRNLAHGGKHRQLVSRLENAARLLHHEVRARLGDIRSKLALFHRFRARCEWYDRERLFELAQRAEASAENRLSEELALFLFDQGLNPLIRPRVSNQEPDLLDPSPEGRIYVESKQYTSSKGAREIIRAGARQAWEMLAKLRGTRYEVREAFFPIFRRGGPRYLPPQRLRFGDFVVYPLLVNIAPSAESGSKSRENPIVIREEELLPEQERAAGA